MPAANPRLLAVPIDRKRLAFDRARVMLSTEAIAGAVGLPRSLACSPRTDRFVYGDAQNQLLLGSLYDPTVAVSLGFPPQIYGFSLRDRLLLGQRLEGTDSSAESILMLDPQTGDQTTIGDSGSNLFDPVLTADESWLALAELRPGEETVATGSICLLRAGDDVGQRQCVADAPEGSWDEQPTWSHDVRFLAFIRQTVSNDATPAQDTRGRLLGGRIQIMMVTIGSENAPRSSAPIDLGIVGGQVIWLP